MDIASNYAFGVAKAPMFTSHAFLENMPIADFYGRGTIIFIKYFLSVWQLFLPGYRYQLQAIIAFLWHCHARNIGLTRNILQAHQCEIYFATIYKVTGIHTCSSMLIIIRYDVYWKQGSKWIASFTDNLCQLGYQSCNVWSSKILW